jgi:hypothetical protein
MARVVAPIVVNGIRYAVLRLEGAGNVRFLLRSQVILYGGTFLTIVVLMLVNRH